MERSPGPLMADVAKLAGVSLQTVSRVLNQHPSVKPATRQRILDAVDQLGYRPNNAARALASRRSGVLGILAVAAPRVGPVNTLFAVERAARTAGYFVSIAAVESPTRGDVAEALDRLSLQGVEGIIAIAPFATVLAELDRRAGSIPMVAVEAAEGSALAAVRVDQVLGAAIVTRHLLEQGASTVVHVSGPSEWWEAEGRIKGWRQALAERGVQPPPIRQGDWTAASGYEAGLGLAKGLKKRSGIFAANDQMALGLLWALRQSGRNVPDDVIVAGFDDIAESAFFSPPLTTVAQDFDAVGHHAIELLLGEIRDGERAASSFVVPPTLVVRESTRRLAARR